MFSCLQIYCQSFYLCQLLKFHQFDWLIEIYLQTEGQGTHHKMVSLQPTEGKNQTLAGAIPFCGEYPGPRFEDKFRSANQIDGISIADGGKMAGS